MLAFKKVCRCKSTSVRPTTRARLARCGLITSSTSAVISGSGSMSAPTSINSCRVETTLPAYGSQMTAMDNAARNAGDVIKKLTLQMNRSRQASITKELIEIISGAEAL
jgi:F-type H+-transporting ATPase subunit gamma